MTKKKKTSKDTNSPIDAIVFAASTYKTLEDVGVEPTPANLDMYQRIKTQVTEIRNSGQGVVLPN